MRESVAQPVSEWIQGPRAIVRHVRPLGGDGFHRRWELERQLSFRLGSARQHIDQRFSAYTKVSDQCSRRLLERRENRGTIEIHGHHGGDGRADAHRRIEIGIASLEGETALVKKLSKHILRVRALEWS